MNKTLWSAKEIARLKELLSVNADKDEIRKSFPDRTWDSIENKIVRIGGRKRSTTDYETLIRKNLAENKILKTKVNELEKEKDAQDQIIRYAKDSIDVLPVIRSPRPYGFTKNKSVESVVLVGSCWHIGEVINKQEMGGLNEYNFDIFCKRLQFLIEKTISFTADNMSSHVFPEINVLLTGDMVSGIIHDELEASNQLNIVEQATVGAHVAAQALLDLARAFPKVTVTCVVGNHGRVKHQKYFKHKQQVNWDYIFYNYLALMLRNQKNIIFNIPLSFWAGVEIQGWKFMIQHGDNVKSWGGIPFYGIKREVSKWIEIKASQRDFFQYFVMSHFHMGGRLQSPTGEHILNGSLKGGDEYAAGLGLYGDPTQLIFGVHPKYGKSWELAINTKYADNNERSRYKYSLSTPIANQELP